MQKVRFITFEGPEGSGKSTHAAALVQRLQAAGFPAVLTREPGGTWLGEAVRRILKSAEKPAPVPAAELFLFLAARAQLAREIIAPLLAEGKIVVCDRFADSTTVYQGYARGVDLAQVRAMNALATSGVMPGLTFLLDIDVRAGLQRAQRRQAGVGAALDRLELEALDFHEKVRQGYLELARLEPRRFQVLDAALPQTEIEEKIWHVVRRVI